jgi:hypothetical protein
MGLLSKKCGYEATLPFRVRCTKPAGHSGRHGARGLSWSSDGKIGFGRKGRKR